MKNIKTLSVFNLLTLLLHISVTYLIQFKVINNQDVGQVANKYPSLFTPADITFGIWGIIYVTLGIFCVYHIIKAWTKTSFDPTNQDTRNVGNWFIISNLATVAWLLAWTQEDFVLSLLCIGIQLIALIIIHLRLHIYNPNRTVAAKVFTLFPLSIYFGWITVATIANISVYLSSTGWDGGQLTYIDWTKIVIGITVLIATLVITTRRNIVFGLVIAWALYGIILKRNAVDGDEYFQVIQTAWIGIAILGLVCVLQVIKNNLKPARFEPPFPIAPHSLK